MVEEQYSQLKSKIRKVSALKTQLRVLSESSTQVLVLCDSRFRQQLLKLKFKNLHVLGLPGSDKCKTFDVYHMTMDKAFRWNLDRYSCIVTVGGGAINDLGGFVAATYMRGIKWINVPTTLLSMVDACYGGKTAINFNNLKNAVGAFYAPEEIWIDITFLETLQERDIISGFGEILKHWLLFDRKAFLKFKIDDLKHITRFKTQEIQSLISSSLKHKSSLVHSDPREKTGPREQLNLGHTFAHALEAEYGWRKFRHGEAVIWGLRYDVMASEMLGILTAREALKILKILAKVPVPELPPRASAAKLWQWMLKDKKNKNKSVRLVGLKSIGKPVTGLQMSRDEHFEVLSMLLRRP